MAKLPILCSWTYRKVKGLPLNYADRSLSYEDNITQMFFRHPTENYKPNKIVNNALNKLLILHADHEQNCSTSALESLVLHMLDYLLLFLLGFLHFGVRFTVEQIKQ